MNLTYQTLKDVAHRYGPSFYLLDTARFCENYRDLLGAFRRYYPRTRIAYSYKTNYTPRLCALVEELGGYAEVVSSMEFEIARRLGIPASHVAYNGPFKDYGTVEALLLGGGMVNLDSLADLRLLRQAVRENPGRALSVGLRCNFHIGDGITSRFGFDIGGPDFREALETIRGLEQVRLGGLHCHFATRSLETWSRRVEGMLALVEELGLAEELSYLDLGGGLFGRMPESLRRQFSTDIPSYEAYAAAVAEPVAAFFAGRAAQPELLIEPGSALSGDVMYFAAPVVSIKEVRGKEIATVLGSIYNINPTLNTKNPPLTVAGRGGAPLRRDLDFGGFTCIESDYLYRHYRGPLAEGDYVVFGNVGSYSVVLKPPFILPNFPVLEETADGQFSVVKRGEVFEDLFATYQF